jgi:RimJ/RimL family protein N-acetyltransferase
MENLCFTAPALMTERLLLEPWQEIQYDVFLLDSNLLVGQVALENLQLADYLDADREARLTLALLPDYQNSTGQGYLLEAAGELLRYGFDVLHLDRLSCYPSEMDHAVRSLPKELGFVYDMPRKNSPAGSHPDRYLLFRSMYLQNRSRRRSRMHYVETHSRIYHKEADDSITADIEFPEITAGNYRITRLYLDSKWEGKGVREDLLEMAVSSIQRRGGQVTSSDPSIQNWLTQHLSGM